MRILLLATLALLLTACVTPKAVQPALSGDPFTKAKTVAYSVHVTPTTEYGADSAYNMEALSLFDALLGAKLKDMGYVKPADGLTPDLTIDIAVSVVTNGSGALRFWVGFGAGRALLEFTASFRDSEGREVASFAGGRSYTGMEMNTVPFAGKTSIATSAAVRSVQQVETFMRNGGKFPAAKNR